MGVEVVQQEEEGLVTAGSHPVDREIGDLVRTTLPHLGPGPALPGMGPDFLRGDRMIVGQLETAAEAGGADQAGSAEERAGSIAVVAQYLGQGS